MTETLTLALVQMAATADRAENMRRIQGHVSAAPEAALLIFPEYACCLGSTADVRAAVRPLDVLDGAHCYNSLLAYDETGCRMGRYDKIHLFPSPQAPLDEGTLFRRGEKVATLQLHGWKIGLSICFDLRFPELYRAMVQPDVLLCPSAFTLKTGQAHWHTLAAARAIENQCYMIAPNQCAADRYAHSLAVDPWGVVLLDAGEKEGVFAVTLRRQRLQAVRKLMPALDFRCIE